jgi:hypothetical protein
MLTIEFVVTITTTTIIIIIIISSSINIIEKCYALTKQCLCEINR